MRSYSNLTATTDSLHMLGVRFQPCGLAAFTNEPLGQFADLRIQSSDINLLFDNAFAEMLCEQRTIPSVSALSKAILYAFSPNPFK